MLKVVTIGGGNGGFSLLRGLKKFPWEINAIVAMTDDGGSTGRLRRELGVLPPGDVRYCLSALSTLPEPWEKVWNYRFEEGGLRGHTAGNILLAGLEKFYGNFLEAVKEMEKLLHVKGKIIPATLDNTRLCVKLKNNKIIRGQDNINHYSALQKEGVQQLFLEPSAKANPRAIKAILEADILLIGPGNLYCSILPSLLMSEIKKAIKKTKALIIFNCNLINREDQTKNFDLDDYVDIINQSLGKEVIQLAIIQKNISPDILKKLHLKKNNLVKCNKAKKHNQNYKIIKADIIDNNTIKCQESDEIAYLRSPVRHDGKKMGKIIQKIYSATNSKKSF